MQSFPRWHVSMETYRRNSGPGLVSGAVNPSRSLPLRNCATEQHGTTRKVNKSVKFSEGPGGHACPSGTVKDAIQNVFSPRILGSWDDWGHVESDH